MLRHKFLKRDEGCRIISAQNIHNYYETVILQQNQKMEWNLKGKGILLIKINIFISE